MSQPMGIKKKSQLTHMDGGTGKGPSIRPSVNSNLFGENLTKIKSKGRKMKCLDCLHFKGINPIDIVTCEPKNNKHKGLQICEQFEDEYTEKK